MSQRLPSPLIPFIGFGPDLPPSTAGVLRSVTNIIPTNSGMAGAPTAVPMTAALPAECMGAAACVDTLGSRRIYAGTAGDLFALDGSAWGSVGRAGGYGETDGLWSFGQFGNATVAANGSAPIQAAVLGGRFGDIAEAPIAKMLVTSANFVMALNTTDPVYGAQGDRWWCSAINDHTSWTPDVASQATTGRIIGDGGDITAAARFGLGLAVFKSRSMFVAQYVGPPVVWQFDRIPGEVGCIGPRAVCDAAGLLVFVGEDDIMAFDGTRPQPVGVGVVRDWFQSTISVPWRYRTICQYEPGNGRVWIFFPSKDSPDGRLDTALVWHISTNRFGVASLYVEAALSYTGVGRVMDDLDGTFDGLATVGWDSQLWLDYGRSLGVFSLNHRLSGMTGACGPSSMTTGDIGDDEDATIIRSIRLRYSVLPQTALATGYTKPVSHGGGAVASSSGAIGDGKFDCRQSGRWHAFRCDFTGDVALSGLSIDASPAGRR